MDTEKIVESVFTEVSLEQLFRFQRILGKEIEKRVNKQKG